MRCWWLALATVAQAATVLGVVVSVDADAGTLTINVTTAKGQVTKEVAEYKLDAQYEGDSRGEGCEDLGPRSGSEGHFDHRRGEQVTRASSPSRLPPERQRPQRFEVLRNRWYQYGAEPRQHLDRDRPTRRVARRRTGAQVEGLAGWAKVTRLCRWPMARFSAWETVAMKR